MPWPGPPALKAASTSHQRTVPATKPLQGMQMLPQVLPDFSRGWTQVTAKRAAAWQEKFIGEKGHPFLGCCFTIFRALTQSQATQNHLDSKEVSVPPHHCLLLQHTPVPAENPDPAGLPLKPSQCLPAGNLPTLNCCFPQPFLRESSKRDNSGHIS